MTLQPTVVDRPKQPYIAIRSTVTMHQLGEVLPPLTPELFEWAARPG